MNNKPYGWHCFIGKGKEEQDFLFINGKGASKPDASWDKVIPLYTHPVNVTYELTMEKCRQQQAEIDFLKKEILEKHKDWKHEGQQAANARAEIDALKAKDLKKSMAIRSLNTQLKKALQYETFNR